MSDSAIILHGVANLLMAADTAPPAPRTGALVMALGNWVGGRYQLTASEIRFQINRANRRFRRKAPPVSIPVASITGLSEGRLFWIFPTTDVACGAQRYRFRLAPGRHAPFLAALHRLRPDIAAVQAAR